jgi:hypothetical protein
VSAPQLDLIADATAVSERIDRLIGRGVIIVDPRQTFVAPEVPLDQVCEGATLFPGTRLHGAQTFVGAGARVGSEGPATLVDAVLAAGAEVASGFVEGAVLLEGARLGWGAHVRPGTILEEQASTAHAVGLKQTILLSFVTVGSLVNVCDALVAGGRSRANHTEIGSGFIHFNFTPWGDHGDKATPSLVGDVVRGVFLRERRIFLGGAAGLVGPGRVDYGAVTAAGSVIRRPVPADILSVQVGRALEVDRPSSYLDAIEPRRTRNLEYLGQLVALRRWYRDVRLARISAAAPEARVPIEAGLANLERCIRERVDRLGSFLAERGAKLPELDLDPHEPCPLAIDSSPSTDHVTWVQSLDDDAVARGSAWLDRIAKRASAPDPIR